MFDELEAKLNGSEDEDEPDAPAPPPPASPPSEPQPPLVHEYKGQKTATNFDLINRVLEGRPSVCYLLLIVF
jgi:hypothetical protein